MKNKKIGIYKITSPSGKVYIGQSIDIEKRWKSYNFYLNRKSCLGTKLYYSFQKYGVLEHKFEIIEECSLELLDEREIYWIKFHNTFDTKHGLNLKKGGLGGRILEETKDKMRKSAVGRVLPKETREKISKANKIKKPKHSLESIEVQRKKISKPIGAFKDGNLVKKYSSLKEAGLDLGVHSGNIIKYMKKDKEFHGFKWDYIRKISLFHEAPVSILEQIKPLTDGDYILPHLLDINEDYLNYMLNSKKEGRYIIMDNSLNELKDTNNGEGYDENRLKYWINKIKPDEFIIPDIWENVEKSIISAEKWSKYRLPNSIKKVVVVQAKTYEEAEYCYKEYKKLGYQKIAFSYGASYYNEISSIPGNQGKALGRLLIICKLLENNIIEIKDKIHLLGCSLTNEFIWYRGINQIVSIDTSNPIMAGIDGVKYQDYGLLSKPKTKIDEVIDKTFDRETLEVIKYNVKKFRTINGL